jgi:hypothetical protein
MTVARLAAISGARDGDTEPKVRRATFALVSFSALRTLSWR